ncbi:MAG: nuclear transport factor 2 family protein [Polaromonas sp.]|uniref:nuclear transport factor 2 family protein n=1 Tax=Polaromonas sp. TaxID=1869339 RepID=UPI0025E13E96|nr:nuclear transport factor 2 family protein [Polaromonas sp.]MBI2726986.1 nuclear transport factor 2 family protein [Polaromonas sp.]
MTQHSVSMDELLDQFQIAQLTQNWGNWRDTGDWERLRNCYTPDATMVTTWYNGPAAGFLEASIQGRKRQPKDRGGMHVIGGTTSYVKGRRATAESRITLLLRSEVHGQLVDITVYGRFIDCLLKCDDGQWRIQSREPVYDKDFLRTVDPAGSVSLDPTELAKYPLGFRHLAYVQASEGHSITLGIPATYSDEEQAIYAKGRAWLEGDKS